MKEERVLRLVTFRSDEESSILDPHLRDIAAAGMAEWDGLRVIHVGRRGGSDDGDRVIASVWDSRGAMMSALGADDQRAEVAGLPNLRDATLEVLPVAVEVVGGHGTPGILRIFRGQVLPGQLDAYCVDARRGTEADVSSGQGPLALYLATVDEKRFVTVSAWTDWDTVQVATGGTVRRPASTRNAERLETGAVQHFEIVPDAPRRARATGARPD